MSQYLLHQALFNARTVREIDQLATGKGDIPGAELMRRAGQAAFTELLENFGRPECIHVFCGLGTNGGDGYTNGPLAVHDTIHV